MPQGTSKACLVIHGGAGEVFGDNAAAGETAAYHDALRRALEQGWTLLDRRGSALDAVTETVCVLEDNPLFNAGKGAVLSSNGVAELDASIMDGREGRCGGVSNLHTVKNPILAARAVMEQTPHSILCAQQADDFAAAQGLERVDNSYFITPRRQKELADALHKNQKKAAGGGTVGAVARDRQGNLAAATSTGGMTARLPGRVSDSSIPGAGTWADDKTCALSCTGTGDIFIRNATARDVACLMEYKNMPLRDAVAQGLRAIKEAGGKGGIIGVDAAGNIVMDFTTKSMFRGCAGDDAPLMTAIFREEAERN